MVNEKKNSILSSLFWKFGERISAQVVSFIVSLVIARILEPEAYGLISIVLVFITLADALVISGIGNSLIQKKDCDDIDFSSVFYFNITFSTIIYIIIFLCAPFVERWYGTGYGGLSAALRILALRVPISAINNVQQAYVSRKMIFKKFFFATLGGTLSSAVIGITFALLDFGVWALVFQYLFNAIVNTFVLWITVKWRPKFLFSFKRLSELLKFGWKLTVSALLEAIYNDIRTLIVGKVYTSEDLAYYNRGRQFPGLVIDNVNSAILGVMFPALCSIQDDTEEIKRLVKKSVKVSSYIITPMLIGLAVIADKLVLVLLTEKWLSAVFFIRIFCIIFLFQPLSKPAQQIINAIGRSDISLILQIITKAVGILGVIFSIKYGVKAVAVAHLVTSVFAYLLDMYVGGRIVKYSLFEQLKDILPSLAFSLIMAAVMCGLGIALSSINIWFVLILQLICGITVYFILSIITRNATFKFILEKGKSIIKKGN